MREPLTFTPEQRGFERVSDDSNALYATDTSRDVTGEVSREEFRVREGRDNFFAQKVQLDDAGRIIGKKSFGRGFNDRDRAVETIESRVRDTTAVDTSRANVGEFLVRIGSSGGVGLAERAHLSRSQQARAADRGKRAPVTTDASRYAGNEGELDYPGVDTPSKSPTVLPKDLRQEQQPKTTETESNNTQRGRESVPETPTGRFASAAETSQLSARDVSLSPGEAFRGDGAVGMNNLGSFSPTGGEERAPSVGTERPPDFERGEDPFDMSDGGGLLDDNADMGDPEPRRIEFGGEQVDLTQQDTGELESMNDFFKRNVDAEVDAERARGGFGTSEFAQNMSSRQVEVATELDRRRR